MEDRGSRMESLPVPLPLSVPDSGKGTGRGRGRVNLRSSSAAQNLSCQFFRMNAAKVILLPRRARPFYGRHPWVFAGAVASVVGAPADGDEVDLISHAGHFIARGIYNSKSKIRVRLYSWSPDQPLDVDFFRARLDE